MYHLNKVFKTQISQLLILILSGCFPNPVTLIKVDKNLS